jgi:hypothetical protein
VFGRWFEPDLFERARFFPRKPRASVRFARESKRKSMPRVISNKRAHPGLLCIEFDRDIERDEWRADRGYESSSELTMCTREIGQ